MQDEHRATTNRMQDEYESLRTSTQMTINSHREEIHTLTTTMVSHESTILSHEQTIKHQQDVHKQYRTGQDHINDLIPAKEKLQTENIQASDYILLLEQKVYKANKTSLELLKQLKDAEVEIETLKQYIIDLK